jgi:hypothetical protein
VHTVYTCTDGYRAVTIQYAQARQAAFGSLSRNDVVATQPVLEEINRLVAPFTRISSVEPQCGAKEDALFVSGLVNQRRSMMLLYWTPSGVRLAMSDVAAGKPPEPPPADMQIAIREPQRPGRGVVTRSGFCGADEYQTELRDGEGPRRAAALSVRVNGQAVAAGELGRALALVPQGFFLHEAKVFECAREGREARIRLLAGGPAAPEPLWISFALSADGRVTGERLD